MSARLRRKRATPRRLPRPENRCSIARCRRYRAVDAWCKTHANGIADTLFSRYVRERDEHCLSCGTENAGQCAHIVSRRYRAIRWNELNAVRLCASCHRRFTSLPVEWEVWVGERFPGRLQVLKLLALSDERPDVAEVIRALRTEAAA